MFCLCSLLFNKSKTPWTLSSPSEKWASYLPCPCCRGREGDAISCLPCMFSLYRSGPSRPPHLPGWEHRPFRREPRTCSRPRKVSSTELPLGWKLGYDICLWWRRGSGLQLNHQAQRRPKHLSPLVPAPHKHAGQGPAKLLGSGHCCHWGRTTGQVSAGELRLILTQERDKAALMSHLPPPGDQAKRRWHPYSWRSVCGP